MEKLYDEKFKTNFCASILAFNKVFGTLNKSGLVYFVLASSLLNYSGNTIKYDDDNDSYSD